MQEKERHIDLVAQLNELRGLLGRLREERAVVAQNADRVAMDGRPAGDQRRAVERLEFLEPRTIHDARNHLAHVEGLPQIARHHTQEVFSAVERLISSMRGPRALLAPVQMRHDLTAHANAVGLVLGQIVAQTGNRAVHLRATQALFVGVFAGGHLHQRRAAQKDLRLTANEDVVVTHAGLIGPACGGRTEHHRDGRDAHLRKFGDLVEEPTGLGKMAGLAANGGFRVAARIAAQIGTRRLHELHIGHAVVTGNFEPTHQLLGVERIEGASTH